jgi:site-specific DNA-methyltransferase (adenine-specific)
VNLLYYGDNLDVLRRYIQDETVDLIYLDPPFKSNQDYNVLFAEQDGSRSAAQIKAFEDTWRWDQAAAAAYEEVVERGGRVSQALQAFRTFLAESDMLAYLAMMAPRLVELRRVLKPTGTIYLHCDPTASHYLKMLMDGIFGPENFRNEIIWQRTPAKGLMSRRLPDNHDVILGYQKTAEATWNLAEAFLPYDVDDLDEKTAGKYTLRDEDGRSYQLTSLINPNPNRPNLTYKFLGVTRVWRWTKERMQEAYEAGLVVQPSPGAVPRFKRYLDEQRGKAIGDVWTDIPPINARAQERLGYPTQKPEALLERIIKTSSNEGNVVLDPFCGCGTAVAVAQRLKRRWIGVDITHLAITLIRHRLFAAYGGKAEYEVIGEPVSLPDAETLAAEDKFQFQWWALGLVGARPTEQKKGADKGIDGRLYFHDEPGGKTKQIILSVKGGDLKATDVRDLRGVIEREKAELGVLVALKEPTKAMRAEAASAGFYKQPVVDQGGQQYPRLQLITVGELLAGQRIKYPSVGYLNVTFKRAPKATAAEVPEQAQLPMVAEPPATRVPRRRFPPTTTR